jgi:DNA polymerase III subunit delta'
MGFGEFLGNTRIVSALRGMFRRRRVPNALLFSGPRGIGKFTLARMFAQAANCQRLTDDFCGECVPCQRIGRIANPAQLIEAGLTERGESADAAAIERLPLIVEANSDVWLIAPDPVRLKTPVARPMIRVGQLRAVQRAAYFQPEGKRRVFILDGADTMRWNDADLFLKILEEPPLTATLILLATTPDAVLPTIRSRCLQFHFAPVPIAAIETFIKDRRPGKPAERKLAAQLSDGSPGEALSIGLVESARIRRCLLQLIANAAKGENYHEIFAATTQLAKQEKESFENVLGLLYSLFTDLLEVSQGHASENPRNPDLARELEALGGTVNLQWISRATEGLDTLEGRLRRNAAKQLGLDALAGTLAVR